MNAPGIYIYIYNGCKGQTCNVSQNKCLEDYILHGKFCFSKSATLLHFATLLHSIHTVIVNKGYKANISSCVNVDIGVQWYPL